MQRKYLIEDKRYKINQN